MKKRFLMTRKLVPMIVLPIIIFALGFGLCFVLDQLFQKPLENHFVDSQNYRQFFSEDIVIQGKDDQNQSFFLKLSLNRKQLQKDQFGHYYFANLIYGDLNKSSEDSFNATKADIPASKFFISYQNQRAIDLSTRQGFDFLLDIDHHQIKVKIENLLGDFLLRDKPEYTKYGSVGDAKIEIGGKSFRAKTFVSTMYSTDYSKYVFFNGYDDMHALTDYLVFWDEAGSFYLVDHTVTEQDNPDYPPHTWVLYKDGVGGWMKKAFEVKIDFKTENSLPQSWLVKIPDLDAAINLHLDQFFEGSFSEGIGSGTVKKSNGTFKIAGFLDRHS